MGNCASATRHAGGRGTWADGDEWEEEAPSEEDHHERSEHAAAEVTIRITKRQLHELMERDAGAGGRGRKSQPSAQQLLADIMNSGEVRHHEQHHEAHWKPALQSIPEAVDGVDSSHELGASRR